MIIADCFHNKTIHYQILCPDMYHKFHLVLHAAIIHSKLETRKNWILNLIEKSCHNKSTHYQILCPDMYHNFYLMRYAVSFHSRFFKILDFHLIIGPAPMMIIEDCFLNKRMHDQIRYPVMYHNFHLVWFAVCIYSKFFKIL